MAAPFSHPRLSPELIHAISAKHLTLESMSSTFERLIPTPGDNFARACDLLSLLDNVSSVRDEGHFAFVLAAEYVLFWLYREYDIKMNPFVTHWVDVCQNWGSFRGADKTRFADARVRFCKALLGGIGYRIRHATPQYALENFEKLEVDPNLDLSQFDIHTGSTAKTVNTEGHFNSIGSSSYQASPVLDSPLMATNPKSFQGFFHPAENLVVQPPVTSLVIASNSSYNQSSPVTYDHPFHPWWMGNGGTSFLQATGSNGFFQPSPIGQPQTIHSQQGPYGAPAGYYGHYGNPTGSIVPPDPYSGAPNPSYYPAVQKTSEFQAPQQNPIGPPPPGPAYIEPKIVKLEPAVEPDVKVDPTAADLLDLAMRHPLSRSEHETLRTALPSLAKGYILTNDTLPSLVSYNPNLTNEFVTAIMKYGDSANLLDIILPNLELALPNLEMLNGIMHPPHNPWSRNAATNVPVEIVTIEQRTRLLHLFLSNSIRRIEKEEKDRAGQQRKVKLLTLFMTNLMRKAIIDGVEFFYEFQEMGMRFIWVKEAREMWLNVSTGGDGSKMVGGAGKERPGMMGAVPIPTPAFAARQGGPEYVADSGVRGGGGG